MIEAATISHTFKSGRSDSVRAIDHMDLSIPKGQFMSFIGPTGCGKTSLLKILGGLIVPTKGKVLLAGHPPQTAQKQGRIGFVFQEPVLFPWRTVTQNVSLAHEVLPAKKRCRTADELLELVGLQDFKNNLPKELSGGMRSRVAIARVLSYEPDVLFMDEPFADLDEVTRDHLNLELLRLWERSHQTIVYVTHVISEAVFLADRIVVLSSRPAKIIKDLQVDFPRPRSFELRKNVTFARMVERLKELLR